MPRFGSGLSSLTEHSTRLFVGRASSHDILQASGDARPMKKPLFFFPRFWYEYAGYYGIHRGTGALWQISF